MDAYMYNLWDRIVAIECGVSDEEDVNYQELVDEWFELTGDRWV